MADTGPCGPCSEIHFDRGAHLSEGPECVPDHSENCPRWLEIWNLVFMEFDQRAGRPPSRCRSRASTRGWASSAWRASLQQVPSNYDTDLFAPIHARMRELLGHDPDAFEAERFSYQVIADHSRAVTFLIADGVLPVNEGRGYVLRRILRRAVRHGRLLGRREPFLAETGRGRHRHHGRGVPAPRRAPRRDPRRRSRARRRQFARTLDAGTGLLEEALIAADLGRAGRSAAGPRTCPPTRRSCPGDVAFRLHDTFGFPIDLTVELAAEYGVGVDRAGFEAALAEQRERSRARARRPSSRSTPS